MIIDFMENEQKCHDLLISLAMKFSYASCQRLHIMYKAKSSDFRVYLYMIKDKKQKIKRDSYWQINSRRKLPINQLKWTNFMCLDWCTFPYLPILEEIRRSKGVRNSAIK